MQIIPLTSDYDQSLTVQLGDAKYELAVAWNERNKIWTFDLTLDPDQELLVAGVPMLIGQDMLSPYALGRGGLVMTDLGAKNTDAGPEDLGDRVIMTWFSVEELAAIAAAQRGAGTPQTIVVPGVPGGGAAPSPGAGSSGGSGGATVINQVINQTVNNFSIEGAGGFSQPAQFMDDTGDEVLVGRFAQNPASNPNPTVSAAIAFLASGTGQVRCYVGGIVEDIGSTGTPSGTQAGSALTISGAMASRWLTGSVTNPGAPTVVKITIQSSSPGTPLTIEGISGVLA